MYGDFKSLLTERSELQILTEQACLPLPRRRQATSGWVTYLNDLTHAGNNSFVHSRIASGLRPSQ